MKLKFAVLVIFLSSLSLFCQNHYRDGYVQPERIMDTLGVKEGMIIGEAGAGEGYLTFHLAGRVGEKGKIYANDIKTSSLKTLMKTAEEKNFSNIETITGEVDDPHFPKDTLDMVVMIMAFHDFTEPVPWLKNLKKYIKPDTRLVIIDRDPERYGRNFDHFMKKDKLIKTAEKGGFNLIKLHEFLERDNIYIFRMKQDK